MDINAILIMMPLVQDTTQSAAASESDGCGEFILVACIIAWIFFKAFRSRCSSCGKLFAMRTYHEEFDHIEYGPKTETTTYSGQQKIKKTTQSSTQYYRMYRRCRRCGYEDIVVRSKTL